MKSTRKKQPQEQQERDVKRPRHLKPYQRDEIIQRVTNGEQKSLLAKEYGVSRAAVTKICQRDNETKVEVPVSVYSHIDLLEYHYSYKGTPFRLPFGTEFS